MCIRDRAGPAGLAAAITAGENDLKALVFEKSNTTGGAANMGMGPLGIGTKIQKKEFKDLTLEEAYDCLLYTSMGVSWFKNRTMAS